MLTGSPSPNFPYRLDAKIGEGAMGVVYRAFDPDLRRQVAIKLIRKEALEGLGEEDRDETHRRFLQEARAAASLSHPGITTIYRIGEEEGNPYIVMEWLEGQSLESVLKSHAPLPCTEAARICCELAEALHVAHVSGVVHRDVKPANLMVLSDGRVKVTDFGIARVDGSELVKTRAGDVLATPLYGSPEQLSGHEVDGRADLFSLGVVLYRALTGRLPFQGRTLAEVTTAVLHRDPVPPRQLVESIPPGLEAIVLRSLAKRAADRYPNAREVAAALRPFVAGTAADPARSPEVTATLPAPRTTSSPRIPAPQAVPAAAVPAIPTVPTRTGLPRDPRRAVAATVTTWPGRPVGKAAVADLLGKLLEFPLHAEPFAGGVAVGPDVLLLLHDGWIAGAIDRNGQRDADDVVESLPVDADVVLHPVPSEVSPRVVGLLASLLGPRKARHADLDSSFANLPALGRKLAEEGFDGVLTLRRGPDTGFVLLDRGRSALALYSEGWGEAPLPAPWETWVSDLVVKASVEEPVFRPTSESYRRLLRDLPVDVTSGGTPDATLSPTATIRKLSGSMLMKSGSFSARKSAVASGPHQLSAPSLLAPRRAGGPPPERLSSAFEHDPARRLLAFLVDELPTLLSQRGKTDSLKYVSSWIPLVARARLHHELPRPGTRESDLFDLVTEDADGKVLHLAHRTSRGTPEALRAFIDRVVAAKSARIKTGDVGGALLVAPSFDEAAADVYRAATKQEGETRGWTFGAIEAFTDYEGFVRIGARRGFHLLLLAETADSFELLLP